jgi:hypothetical protein
MSDEPHVAYRQHHRGWYLIPAAMMGLAVLPLPYIYYEILRLIVAGAAAYIAYWAYQDKMQGTAATMSVIAVLFNPVFPIYMSRSGWFFIDIAVAAVFLFVWKGTGRSAGLVTEKDTASPTELTAQTQEVHNQTDEIEDANNDLAAATDVHRQVKENIMSALEPKLLDLLSYSKGTTEYFYAINYFRFFVDMFTPCFGNSEKKEFRGIVKSLVFREIFGDTEWHYRMNSCDWRGDYRRIAKEAYSDALCDATTTQPWLTEKSVEPFGVEITDCTWGGPFLDDAGKPIPF